MTPDFRTLPQLPGHPDLRNVGGIWMTDEQYRTESWRIVRTYTRDDGSKGASWAADLDGLKRWGLLQRERRQNAINAARYRREEDDEQARWVASLVEAE